MVAEGWTPPLCSVGEWLIMKLHLWSASTQVVYNVPLFTMLPAHMCRCLPGCTVVVYNSAPTILCSRILWVLGCWMSRLCDDVRPALYQALVGLFADPATQQDHAVALTLLTTLKSAVDDWNFQPEAFVPLASTTIQSLYTILGMAQPQQTPTPALTQNLNKPLPLPLPTIRTNPYPSLAPAPAPAPTRI